PNCGSGGGDAGVGGDAGGDGGVNGLDVSGGGCSCDAGSRGAPLGSLVLALFVGALVIARRRRAGALLALLLAAGTARAEGFDAQLYQPTTSSTGYFSQDSA